jgi:alanyl aminopeptidase
MRSSLSALLVLAACAPSAKPVVPHYASLADARAEQEVRRTGRLPSDVRPLGYALSLDLDPAQPRFAGQVDIAIALDRPRSVIFLHGKGLAVQHAEAVQQNGRNAPIAVRAEVLADSGILALHLATPLAPGLARLSLHYDAAFGTRLTGLYRVEQGGAAYAFTQHEAIHARETLPCFDEPRFKTPFDVTLQVRAGDAAIANGAERTRTPLEAGRERVQFARTEPLPTYLLAIATGPFDVVAGPTLPPSPQRPLPLPIAGVAVRGRGKDLGYALADTPKYVERLEAFTGIAYPYAKLHLIAVPDFAAGAMENAGAITFRDSLLLLGDAPDEGQKRRFSAVNAHELAHQWFGNLVTMPWWDDVWLNESFATWMGTRILDELEPSYRAQRGELLGVHGAMEVDSQPSARRIREPVLTEHDIDNAFDAITYQKGGAVLRMFEGYLGEARFRDGIQRYLRKHAGATATADDLIAALSEVSNPGVAAAFRGFLTGTGVPTVTTVLGCDGKGARVTLSQARYTPMGVTLPPSEPGSVPVCVAYGDGADRREACTLLPPTGSSELALPLTNTPCPGFVHPNADARGYYRYGLSPAALDVLVAAAPQLRPSERMSLVANLEAAMRSGELDAGNGLNALFRLLADPEREVLEAVLDALRGVRDALVADADLPAFRARIAKALGPRLAALSVFPVSPASPEDKLLRAVLVRAVALDAEEPGVLVLLAPRGAALLAGNAPEELPKELYGAALWAHLAADGQTALPALLARLASEEDGFMRGRLLSAIASSPNPAQVEQVMNLSVGDTLRVNERMAPVFGQLGRRATREAAYAYFKEHLDALAKAVSGHAAGGLLSGLSVFCSAEHAADITAHLADKAALLSGGPRQLALALDNVRSCAVFASAQRGHAAEALRLTTAAPRVVR